jgi:hypothetical protein
MSVAIAKIALRTGQIETTGNLGFHMVTQTGKDIDMGSLSIKQKSYRNKIETGYHGGHTGW